MKIAVLFGAGTSFGAGGNAYLCAAYGRPTVRSAQKSLSAVLGRQDRHPRRCTPGEAVWWLRGRDGQAVGQSDRRTRPAPADGHGALLQPVQAGRPDSVRRVASGTAG